MQPPSRPLTDIADLLRHSRRVLALCHIAPDGDAIGALLGLGWLLAELPQPPAVSLACADPIPPELAFLPGVADIVAQPPNGTWDVVVGLDASDPARLGAIFRPATYGAVPVVIIDHHITNLYFGTINHVDPAAAATSQILVELADALGVRLSRAAAVCLLTGVVTDTLGFRTTNVTPAVLAAATRLMTAGAPLADITERALNRRPLSVMRLWGLALNRLHLEHGVVWTEVTRAMRRQAGVPGTDDGGLVSHLINAEEGRVAAVFRELEGRKVEIGLRARKGYDVAAVALRLGGGGHPQAAGCTLPGALTEVEAQVLPLLIDVSLKTPDR